jgi:hypothetical protein
MKSDDKKLLRIMFASESFTRKILIEFNLALREGGELKESASTPFARWWNIKHVRVVLRDKYDGLLGNCLLRVAKKALNQAANK